MAGLAWSLAKAIAEAIAKDCAMHPIDTPSRELPQEHPQPSVNTTVPVEQAQRGHERQEETGAPNSPQLPHERDQSVGMTDGNPSPLVQQAYRDVERGLVNTDAGREAHNVGKPVVPPEPAPPGTPGPVEPDHR